MKHNTTSSLEHILTSKTESMPCKPVIFDVSKQEDRKQLGVIFEKQYIRYISDDFLEQMLELFQIQNPTLVYAANFKEIFDEYIKKSTAMVPLWQQGNWVYYPWLASIVHILKDEEFQNVRTARNRNLITAEEQKKYYNTSVGIAGLSVGNSVALALIVQGGAKHIKLADHDRLALSNMNRVRTGIENLGCSKVELTTRQIYCINPYAEVELFTEGLTEETIEDFVTGLDVLIDEIDNMAMKYLLRVHAKNKEIPVVMAADNGDTGVVFVERYDENPELPFFHGRLGDTSYETLKNLDKFGIGKAITQLVGPEYVTQRMKESLLEMGKTIVSWPQLGGAALLNGSAVAYCVRKITNNQPLENNHAIISLDEKLVPDYNLPTSIAARKKITKDFKKIFGL